MREYRFDVVRVICMTYLVTYIHLYEYIYPQGRVTDYLPACMAMAHASLGMFTFVSGYLHGKKYSFGSSGNSDIWTFYKKRLLRIVPLFVIASIALWIIGFNSTEATWNGLLCISPFVDPRPRTLYYIPIILWCYLLTPLLARNGLRWRMLGSLILMGGIVVARLLFPSVDSRFVFNVLFYLVGLVSASCFDWKFNFAHGTAVKSLVVLVFVILVTLSICNSWLSSTIHQMALGAVGVFVILFVCEGISSLGGHQFFYTVSYASMACYMFHRFFFWMAELLWNPTDTSVKWLYMAGVVFPVIVVLSYGIQKMYDKMMK